jgi:hypothetical protein
LLHVALFQTLAACSQRGPIEWNIVPSLKCDAFYFLNAISEEPLYNRLYPRDKQLWASRIGPEAMDSVNAITREVSGLGFKACYLVVYHAASSLDDLIRLIEDWERFQEATRGALTAANDYRQEAALADLDALGRVRHKVTFVFRRMQEEGWEDDWRGVSERLRYDIRRIRPELRQFSPTMLSAAVHGFLGRGSRRADSLSTVYYLYYCFPNAFKLPFGMMGTWSIQQPTYFFSGYLHEALHDFSIYRPGLRNLHERLVGASPLLARDRDVLVNQLFESDDEWYVLAAEAYLSVKLGIRTHDEALEYLRTAQGGTAMYSVMLYEYLRERFQAEDGTFENFLRGKFFGEVSADSIDTWLRERKHGT